jgi:hypothetical protein
MRSKSIASLLLAGSIVLGFAQDAQAQQVTDEPVSPTAKGVIGGAFLGAEVVMMTEAIIGVRSVWPYLVGGGIGAAAGGVGGYFIESSVSDGRIPVFMLAGGLALVIPTMVLTLNATRYRSPAEDNIESQAPANGNEPKADPGKPGGTPVQGPGGSGAPIAPVAPPPGGGGAPLSLNAAVPFSLVNLNQGSWALGVPVPDVRPVYTPTERSKYGLRNATEVRLPVVNVSF